VSLAAGGDRMHTETALLYAALTRDFAGERLG
jgi:hypothetical protein